MARLGSRSPLSYFWKARGPPPIMIPAASCVRRSFLRMRRISSGSSNPSFGIGRHGLVEVLPLHGLDRRDNLSASKSQSSSASHGCTRNSQPFRCAEYSLKRFKVVGRFSLLNYRYGLHHYGVLSNIGATQLAFVLQRKHGIVLDVAACRLPRDSESVCVRARFSPCRNFMITILSITCR